MRISGALQGDNKLELSQAVLIYDDRKRQYATVHDVDSDAGRLLPGRPISLTALQSMIEGLGESVVETEMVPEYLLYSTPDRLIWHQPACRKEIFFKTADKKWNADMGGSIVWHPHLLFMAKHQQIYIWALRDGARPTKDTPLYRAPYYNIYEAGNMCTGSAVLPKSLLPSSIAAWQCTFFDTCFTHTNVTSFSKLTRHRGGHAGLWREMETVAADPFATPNWADYLAPIDGLTVKGLLKI